MNSWRSVGMALLLAGAASTAAAQELRIQSFARDGTITFNQTAGAGEYHVERRLDPGWAHLFTEPVPGSGIVTGSVSVIDPSMLVRVRAGRLDEYLVIDLSGGADATNYPVSTLAAVPSGGWTEEHRTSKLVLRRIPAGTFMMGSPEEELVHRSDERQHQVTLSWDFHIGVFEVTQEQWYRVMGDWPSYFTNDAYRASRPVEQVSYDDIRGASAGAGWPGSGAVDVGSFLGRLRAKTGLGTLDLPTESQWEYACRAGTTTALSSGQNLTDAFDDPAVPSIGRYWHNGGSEYMQNGDTTVGSARVGSYLPNGWGLYDMHGNAYEWCLDWYGQYPWSASDPEGPPSGVNRVNRGGGWSSSAQGCRSATRGDDGPSTRYLYRGFRVAKTNPPPFPPMVFIPAGSFSMGDSLGDEGGTDELPVHTVSVSGFCMDRYEVTEALWDEVADWAASHGYDITAASGSGKGEDHPVYSVTWYECVKWCNARSEKEGRIPAYYTSSALTAVYRSASVNVQHDWVRWDTGYRLPTEAEWEKAARGGLSGQRFPWGETIQHALANYYSSSYSYDTSPTRGYHPDYNIGLTPATSPGGAFAANGYGLCDMAGNVWEWCWDRYSSEYYGVSPATDPQGPSSGSFRVVRGGSWNRNAGHCRVADRSVIYPDYGGDFIGFRAVLPPGQP